MKTALSALLTVCLFSAAAHAATETKTTTAPTVVVTAARLAVPIDQVGSSVTVLDGDELEAKGYRQVADALREVPGLSVVNSGGPGALTNVRLRGSNPGEVKVLIDGVNLNDPSNANGEYDFDSLALQNVDRIEVLRGPQSALYGSDAMGGVINIITKTGEGPAKFTGRLEGGSYGTHREGAGVSGSYGRAAYSLSAQNQATDGFSRSRRGSERDGMESQSVVGKGNITVTDNASLEVTGGYTKTDTDFDPFGSDGPAYADKQSFYGKATARVQMLDRVLEHVLGTQVARAEREYNEPLNGFSRFSSFDSTVQGMDYQANLKLRTRDMLSAGVNYERQDAQNVSISPANVITTDLDARDHKLGFYGQYMLGLGKDTTLTLGGRRERHDRFGTDNTYRATAIHNFRSTGTSIHGSYGTAVKVPTLYQLFSFYGNPGLMPEESRGMDLGFDQSVWNDQVNFGVTAFKNYYTNLIDYDFGTNMYGNIAKAKTQGLESTVKVKVTDAIATSLNHTYTYAINEQTKQVLPRRPKHLANLGVDFAPPGKDYKLGALLRYVGAQRDSDFSSAVDKEHLVADVYGDYAINENLDAYARIENLFDNQYQEVDGYNVAGFSVYVGLRATY